MAIGTVISLDRGIGFINVGRDSRDVLFRPNDARDFVEAGDLVEFEVVPNGHEGQLRAINIRLR